MAAVQKRAFAKQMGLDNCRAALFRLERRSLCAALATNRVLPLTALPFLGLMQAGCTELRPAGRLRSLCLVLYDVAGHHLWSAKSGSGLALRSKTRRRWNVYHIILPRTTLRDVQARRTPIG
jgi:hypothetical protein